MKRNVVIAIILVFAVLLICICAGLCFINANRTQASYYKNMGGARSGVAGSQGHPPGPDGPPSSGRRPSNDVEADRGSIPPRSGAASRPRTPAAAHVT
ncbi:MAG: hypothetical protein FRX48_07550 [Lasallia pustulata]|uniref:Uncharacterized protein n=1 Tax=Lasallia pustulata TaxID=136370 RepID=A0A5M8PHK9_9LECA|nr:MAG: hypothetical protein FRX48_07550 [Lasallia pustulata]